MDTKAEFATHRAGISRRTLLQLGSLLALRLWPGALRAEGAGNTTDFTFLVVNDLHYQSERCGAWFERVVSHMKANAPAAALCLILGDYAEHGAANEIGPAHEIFRGLQIPVFGVPGNHDYLSPTDRSAYENLIPNSLNYQFQQNGWQFIALDSTEGQKFKGTVVQDPTLQWLDATLPKIEKWRPTILFTHFPLGLLTPYRPMNADAVLARFRDYNLQAVFNGHFHGFTARWFDHATITTNRCCAISRENHDGTKEKGYFVCDAKDGHVTRTFVEVPIA